MEKQGKQALKKSSSGSSEPILISSLHNFKQHKCCCCISTQTRTTSFYKVERGKVRGDAQLSFPLILEKKHEGTDHICRRHAYLNALLYAKNESKMETRNCICCSSEIPIDSEKFWTVHRKAKQEPRSKLLNTSKKMEQQQTSTSTSNDNNNNIVLNPNYLFGDFFTNEHSYFISTTSNDENLQAIILPLPRSLDKMEEKNLFLCQRHFEYNQLLFNSLDTTCNPLYFQFGICSLTSPEKDKSEDAYFITDDSRSFGVADGVSQWKALNIDSSAYSNKIMQEAKKLIEAQPRPKETLTVLKQSFQAAQESTLGSCTVLLMMLDGLDTLVTTNIGDSGFRIVRDGKFVYRSLAMQHGPNQPYQLGTDCLDTPDNSISERIKIKKGDIIIAGTDGFFDNLFETDMLLVLSRSDDPINCAKSMADAAMRNAKSKTGITPFSQFACNLASIVDEIPAEKLSQTAGGKPDDITCIVAFVGEEPTQIPGSSPKVERNASICSLTNEVFVGKASTLNEAPYGTGDDLDYYEYMQCQFEYEHWRCRMEQKVKIENPSIEVLKSIAIVPYLAKARFPNVAPLANSTTFPGISSTTSLTNINSQQQQQNVTSKEK